MWPFDFAKKKKKVRRDDYVFALWFYERERGIEREREGTYEDNFETKLKYKLNSSKYLNRLYLKLGMWKNKYGQASGDNVPTSNCFCFFLKNKLIK